MEKMGHFWVVLGFPTTIHGGGSGGVKVSGPGTSSDSGFSQFLVEALRYF